MDTGSLCPQHSGIITDIMNLKNSEKEQWDAIKGLQNRLPVWATLMISVLMFALGATMTYAAFAVKVSELTKTH